MTRKPTEAEAQLPADVLALIETLESRALFAHRDMLGLPQLAQLSRLRETATAKAALVARLIEWNKAGVLDAEQRGWEKAAAFFARKPSDDEYGF